MVDKMVVMTGAEFRLSREYLGLSTKWMADYLEVNERELFRWEKNEAPIPDGVAGEVDDLVEAAALIVDKLTDEFRARVIAADGRGIELLTYRKDEEFWMSRDQIGPEGRRFPARWHRMICARVAANVPGLVVDYWDPPVLAA